MKTPLRPLLIFSIAALLWAAGQGHAAPVAILPVSGIHPGMIGVGRTVFQGDSIEEFQVRILGTLKNFMPRKDVILAELLGDRLKYTGVIAGMSGSPVYVDGKLIGAVAYGWSFSKDPIAGITPIEQMLDIPVDTADGGPGAAPARKSRLLPGKASGQYDPFQTPEDPFTVPGLEPLTSGNSAATAATAHLERLAVPLVFSGCRTEVLDRFAPFFRRLGLIPVLGGGSGGADDSEAVFDPGAPVAAQLVRGDLSLAATGTLTWRDGDKILAFGHPFLQFGPVDFPMTAASILTVLPNLQSSFKMSNSTRFMGSIRTDHSNGILGIVGEKPDMLPFHIRIVDPLRGDESFNYEIVRHKRLTPTLAALVTLNSLTSRGDIVTERMYRMHAEIQLGGMQPISMDDMLAGNAAPIQIVTDLQGVLQYLYTNQFGPADVRSVDLRLDVSQGNPAAQVSELYLDRTTVYPGDTLGVDVVLTPFGREKFRETFRVPIPNLGEDTRLFLLVGSGDMLTRTEFQLSPDRFRYTSLEHLVRLINSSRKENYLYLKLFRQDRSVMIDGREMEDLPPSVWSVMRSGNTSGVTTPLGDTTVSEQNRSTDFVLNGLKLLQLNYKTTR